MSNNTSPCENFNSGHCRSCACLTFSREEEIRQKESRVQEFLVAALRSKPRVFPLWSPSRILPSRTKAKLQVSGTSSHPMVGLVHFDGRTLSQTELLNCPLHLPRINEVLKFLSERFIREQNLTPYNPLTRQGELKGIIILSNEDASQMILRFVCQSPALELRLRRNVSTLQAHFPEILVVSLNIQPIAHAILEGEREILLSENNSIQEHFDGFVVEFGPQSFKQVTHETANALYAAARQLVSTIRPNSLLDLYCGTGAFSFAVAGSISQGLGLEVRKDAVDAARRNASQFPHLRFDVCNVETELSAYLSTRPDFLMVNPPRRGLTTGVIDSILSCAPFHILYSSCHLETLARDLLLLERSYEVIEVRPFDMFPQTPHLECLVFLRRLENAAFGSN